MTTNRMRVRVAAGISAVIAAALIGPAAGTANAAGTLPMDDSSQQALVSSYNSLAASLHQRFGQQASLDPIAALSGQLQQIKGQAQPSEPSAGTESVGAFTLQVDAFNDTKALVDKLNSSSATSVDARVMKAGAVWAQKLTDLRVPDLAAPELRAPSVTGQLSYAKSQLGFGLVLNKALSSFVAGNPNLVATAAGKGTRSPLVSSAWEKSIASAVKSSQSSLSAGLIDPCSAAGLIAMSTGNARSALAKGVGSSGCGGCVVSGLYQHSSLYHLWDNPGGAAGKTYPAGTTAGLPSWLKNQITSTNSLLRTSSSTPETLGCSQGSAAAGKTLASGAVDRILSGISFDR